MNCLMTADQWRALATVSEALLDLEILRNCGVIRGGPVVNADFCRRVVQHARAHGVVTMPSEVTAATERLMEVSDDVSSRESA